MPQWDVSSGESGGDTSDNDVTETDSDDTTTQTRTTAPSPTPVHSEPGVGQPDEEEETQPRESDDTSSGEPETQTPDPVEETTDATARDDMVGEQARDLRQRAIEQTGVDPAEHEGVDAGDLIRVRQRGDRLVTEPTDTGQRLFARRQVMDEEGFEPDEFELVEVDDGFTVETTDVFDQRLREEVGGGFADVVDPADREEGFDDAQFFRPDGADVAGPGGVPDRPTIGIAPRPAPEVGPNDLEGTDATAQPASEREAGFEDGPLTAEVAQTRFEQNLGHDDFELQETDDGFRAVVEGEPTRRSRVSDAASQAFGVATLPARTAFDRLPDGIERDALRLSTLPPRFLGQRAGIEGDSTLTRDAALTAAAVGVAAPEPVSTVGGAAILGGAALAAGAGVSREIEIDPMQEFGHDEVQVPEEQRPAEISVPAEGAVRQAELQPTDEFGSSEVDVPEQRQQTDPELLQTEQVVIGQQFGRQRRRELEEEDGTTIITDEDIREVSHREEELVREQHEQSRWEVAERFGEVQHQQVPQPAEENVPGRIEEIGSGIAGAGEPEVADGEEMFFERFQRAAEEEIEQQSVVEEMQRVEDSQRRFWETGGAGTTQEGVEASQEPALARETTPAETFAELEMSQVDQQEFLTVPAAEEEQSRELERGVEEMLEAETAAEVEATGDAHAEEMAREQAIEQVEEFAQPQEVAMEMAEPALTETVHEFAHPEATVELTGEGGPGSSGTPQTLDLNLDGSPTDPSDPRRDGFAGERVEFDVQDARELDAEIDAELSDLSDELDDAFGGM